MLKCETTIHELFDDETSIDGQRFMYHQMAYRYPLKEVVVSFNNIEIMDRFPKELNNQIFRKLKSIKEVQNMTSNQRLEYQQSYSESR